MSGFSVAKQAADAFNRHGKLTARLVENDMAVEIRHADTGKHLTTLWGPGVVTEWTWPLSPNAETYRTLPKSTTIPEIVRAVATSVLDEAKR